MNFMIFFLQSWLVKNFCRWHYANDNCILVLLNFRHSSVIEVCFEKTLFEIRGCKGRLIDAEGLNKSQDTLNNL